MGYPDALHEDHVVEYSCSTLGDTTEGPEQRDEVCMITHETLLRVRASSTVCVERNLDDIGILLLLLWSWSYKSYNLCVNIIAGATYCVVVFRNRGTPI